VNIYVELTSRFNTGRTRVILSSGQAVVFYRLAVMSKDGDWIIREDDEALAHVLSVLGECGARYRFGAPLDRRWLAGGWSSHFEFSRDNLRVRTDFVSRPPRIDAARLRQIWIDAGDAPVPVVPLADLAELKKTNREKDYAVIGELARRMTPRETMLRYSRSAQEILACHCEDAATTERILRERGIDPASAGSRDTLEAALDAERRRLMRANEQRLSRYAAAAGPWERAWSDLHRSIATLSLTKAHRCITEQARLLLPFTVQTDTEART